MTTKTIIVILIGLFVLIAIIAAVAYFAYKFGVGKGGSQISALTSERDMLNKQLEDNKLLIEDKTNSAKQETENQIRSIKEESEKRIAEIKSDAQAEIAKLEQQNQEQVSHLEEQYLAREKAMSESHKKQLEELKAEAKAEKAKFEQQNQEQVSHLEEQYLAREKVMSESHKKQLEELKAEAKAEKAKFEQQNQEHVSHLEEQYLAREKAMAENHEKQIKNMQEQQSEQLQTLRTQQNEQLKAFKEQLENSTRELLEKRQKELQTGNNIQMETFLKPFTERLSEMKQAFEENKESNHRNSAVFEQQIKAMQERTQKLGEDAKHLTEALSSNGKVQGDWGEQMLETILQNSGLQEGINYETQVSVADDNNKQKRPDVIVHCPDGRDVIIDSKVSLSAYLNYISAKSDEERDIAAKENLKSIKKHIDELVKKDYSKHINNANPTSSAISTVLMFIPNEGSYVLAMESDKNLANDAFKKGILLLNPTNLMLALNIVSQLWNIQNQEDHCKKIIAQAGALYDKFCTFSEHFIDVGDKLNGSVKAFTAAKSALNEGSGNIVKRLDELKTLGVSVKKEIDNKLRE